MTRKNGSHDAVATRPVSVAPLTRPQNLTPAERIAGYGLSPRQQRAVLLLAEGKTVTEAAKALDLSRETVSGWQRRAAFEAALNLVRAEIMESATGRLLRLVYRATEAMEQALQSEDEQVRLKAAIEVLRQTELLSGTRYYPGPTTPDAVEQARAHDEEMARLFKFST